MRIMTRLSWLRISKTLLLIYTTLSLSLSLSTSGYAKQTNSTITRTTSSDDEYYSMVSQFLVPHNTLRSRLGLPPVRWSARLADYAYWWADQRRGDCSLVHSGGDYGENLFWGSGREWGPGDAVGSWGDERRYYDYYTNSCLFNQQCLHYTQMVWRSSTSIGCAKINCYNGDTFISCNYYPHGNVIGQRPF